MCVSSLLESDVYTRTHTHTHTQNYDWKDLGEKTGAYMIESDKAARLEAAGAEGSDALDRAYRNTLIGIHTYTYTYLCIGLCRYTYIGMYRYTCKYMFLHVYVYICI